MAACKCQFISSSEKLLIPRLNPQAFSTNLMSNLVRMLNACVIVFSTNAKRPF